MKKNMFFYLNCILICIPNIVLANDLKEDYDQLLDISKVGLSVFSWIGYALAMGMLIWIGIKYILSNANEKANLKGIFPKYILGVILIFTCATIANAAANVASSSGDNTAGGLIDKGFEIGKLEATDKVFGDYDGDLGDYVVKFLEKENRILVYASEDVEINYKDSVGKNPKVTAPKIVEGKNFKYWFVVMEKDNQTTTKMYYSGNEFDANGTDSTLFKVADTKYTIYAIYEGQENYEKQLKEEYKNIDFTAGTTAPVEPLELDEPAPSIPSIPEP